MLSLVSPRQAGRRSFLQVGTLGFAGLSLDRLLAQPESTTLLRDRSVVFLFLHGGPSQTETFDPKMTAPPGIQSVNGEVATSLPGVTFGSALPQLARRAHLFSVVRSFQTGDGNHDIKPISSRHSLNANLGSLVARVRGTTDGSLGMPTNVALFPRAVSREAQAENNNFGRFASAGSLGAAYVPFVPGSGPLQQDMQLRLDPRRLDDRRSLLTQLDRGQRLLEAAQPARDLGQYRQQAFSTLLSGVASAFHLDEEDPRVVARYDTAPHVRPDQISRRWNNYQNYVDNAQSLGKLMLLARRLCERGSRFVTVTTNFVWDMHADVNNAGVQEGMEYMGRPLDHAVSTFLDDLEARGLRDKILLVVCGEMGRTPKINARGGRDHWGRLAPLALYGGGLKMGQVVGASTADAGQPATQPYGIPHLIATVMHSLFDLGELRLQAGLPTDLVRSITQHAPIQELV